MSTAWCCSLIDSMLFNTSKNGKSSTTSSTAHTPRLFEQIRVCRLSVVLSALKRSHVLFDHADEVFSPLFTYYKVVQFVGQRNLCSVSFLFLVSSPINCRFVHFCANKYPISQCPAIHEKSV